MKAIKVFITAIMLFIMNASFAQSMHGATETFDYPDLKNPKIVKIQKILDAKEIDEYTLSKEYDAIFNGENLEDKLHLFVYDLSNPWGSYADFITKYSAQVTPVIEALNGLKESNFKTFAIAVLCKGVADRTMENMEEKTKYLSSAFHNFLHLVSRGDKRSYIPLAKTASELYVLGFKDEHLTENLILELYSNYFSALSKHEALFDYLRKGLFYENTYNITLSEAEKTKHQNYKDISSKIIKRYLVNFPDKDQYIIHHLWKSHLLTNSFLGYRIEYNPEIGKSISNLIEGFKNDKNINYNRLKPVDFLFHYFLDEKTDLDIQDYIQFFNSKKEAYNFLMGYLEKVSEHEISMELLNRQPEWTKIFKSEIEQDISGAFPYVVRYSKNPEIFLTNPRMDVNTLQKSVENFNYIMSLLFNKEVRGGKSLYRLYQYSQLMAKALEQNLFKKNSKLKWDAARMLLDFEYAYLATNAIHSPTILGISETFDNWTSVEIKTHRKDIQKKLLDYLKIYEKVSEKTTEGEIVKGELKKITTKFGLL